MTVRLPLLGSAASRAAEPEIPVVDDALRASFALPSLAIVASAPHALERAVTTLREAARARALIAAELHVVVQDGPARVVPVQGGVRVLAPLLELPARLRDAEPGLRGAGLLLATGAAVVAIRRPTVAVLVTAGLASQDWGREARSVRAQIDLVVPELDEALAVALLARLVRVP